MDSDLVYSAKSDEIPCILGKVSLRLLELTSHSSYQRNFEDQYGMYEADREILLQSPSSTIHTGMISFRELVDFIAHVADCYLSLTKKFPEDLIEILSHHKDLEVELRSKIVGSLALLKRKGIIDSSKSVRRLLQYFTTTLIVSQTI